MLLFYYVNLRLLKKVNTKIGEYLEDAILVEELEEENEDEDLATCIIDEDEQICLEDNV